MINDKGYLNEDLLNGDDVQQALTNSHNLVLIQVPNTDGSYLSLGDTNTTTYQLDNHHLYLFINSHPQAKSLIFVNGYNGETSLIYRQVSTDTLNFQYNSSTKILTVQSLTGCRGYLYQVGNLANS